MVANMIITLGLFLIVIVGAFCILNGVANKKNYFWPICGVLLIVFAFALNLAHMDACYRHAYDKPDGTICEETENNTNNWCDLGYYYIGAEKLSETEKGIEFIDEIGGTWYWDKQENEEFPDDMLYLLCVHNEGTPDDVTDDTLMVIWREVRQPIEAVG